MDPISSAGTSDTNKQSVELFREACGATAPMQLHVEYMGHEDSAYRVLYQPFALIGRDPRCDLVLDHAEVNLRHAYMQQIAGRIYCVDLDTRDGTHWLAGAKHSDWLDIDQRVRIGPYWVRPYRGQDSPSSATRPYNWTAVPEVSLEFVNQTGPASVWKMTPVLALVGRSKHCRVHLVGASISSFHCSLLRTPVGLWLVDLFGKDGVWVNDALVRCCKLDEGDRLQVGRFLIRVHYESGSLLPGLPPPRSTTADAAVAASPTLEAPRRPSTVDAPVLAIFKPPQPPATQTATVNPQVPATSAGAESFEALLTPFARQLGQMQQQMFDQFQQGMMMMFQMFHTLQKDQVGLIRKELDHLHRLNEEVRSIQTQLLERSQPQPAPAQTPRPVPAANRKPAPAPPRVAPISSPGPEPKPVAAKAGASSESKSTAGKEATAAPFEHPEPQAHLWLSQRLLSLQQERQTHWQKIMNFLTRTSNGN